MMQSYPNPILVEPFLKHFPTEKADACVIWLHGLGADGHDFEGILPQLGLPKQAKIRFIFPTAALLPVTLNAGMTMRAWYDIRSLQLRQQADWQNIELSANYVQSLVQQQMDLGVAAERILLAGFSQGGVIALHTALLCQTQGLRLAGVMALSTYYPEGSPSLKTFEGLPILMAHGLYDQVCEIQLARVSKVALEALNAQVLWLEFPMAHQVCEPEIQAITAFILDKLPLLSEFHHE